MNKEPQCVVMPFGKYRGEMLGDIPRDYLVWVSETLTLDDDLLDAIDHTIEMLPKGPRF